MVGDRPVPAESESHWAPACSTDSPPLSRLPVAARPRRCQWRELQASECGRAGPGGARHDSQRTRRAPRCSDRRAPRRSPALQRPARRRDLPRRSPGRADRSAWCRAPVGCFARRVRAERAARRSGARPARPAPRGDHGVLTGRRSAARRRGAARRRDPRPRRERRDVPPDAAWRLGQLARDVVRGRRTAALTDEGCAPRRPDGCARRAAAGTAGCWTSRSIRGSHSS